MERYHTLQIRFSAEKVHPGMEFSYRGNTFILGDATAETLAPPALPIGVIMNGFTRQFVLTQEGQPAGAAWFYFYRAFEGKNWAVLDEMELYNARACA